MKSQTKQIKKQKTKTLCIRGCMVRVKAEDAPELALLEAEMLKRDWKANRVD